MPISKLVDFLNKQNIKYVTIAHSTAYTAQEIAALTHTPGKELAKTVIVKIDGNLTMVVLPSSYKCDLSLLRAAIGAKTVELANESEFTARFPECETGAMPPFGNLYGMAVYVDQRLTQDKEIAFNAGSHNELVRLSYKDFESLTRPTVLDLAAATSRTKTA